jgi:quinol monooxygenase YgiN
MHIQIVNFKLNNIKQADYEKLCRDLAPQFAAMPGLISKVWLADPATNTYGGVYTWKDRAAYEAYTRSDLFKGVGSNPNLTNVTSRSFDVLEDPTRQTRGFPTKTAAA